MPAKLPIVRAASDASRRIPIAAVAPALADHLLAWYDRHARTLPWRAPPGAPRPPAYRVWLSEIMLQQTTVATVRTRFPAFVAAWPDVAALARADDAALMAAWAGLGYYARARNLIACARAVMADHDGLFPASEAQLRALPGIGAYTAAAIAAIAFDRRAVVVDANVARVVARLFAVSEPLPAARPAIAAATDLITPDRRPGDFAQAMMDLGSTVCTPRAPRCFVCPLADVCRARAAGLQDALPTRVAKQPRPQRFGTAFWLRRGGDVLLVRRPASGLLGGMRALPCGAWGGVPPALAGAPPGVAWQLIDRRIDHVFTHFRLELALAVARIQAHSAAPGGGVEDGTDRWWPVTDLGAAGLPSIFAKAAAQGLAWESGA